MGSACALFCGLPKREVCKYEILQTNIQSLHHCRRHRRGRTEIAETEYNAILAVIRNRPAADGKGYRLKTDLTWEAYDLPPEPAPSDADELSDAEALNVILGVTA